MDDLTVNIVSAAQKVWGLFGAVGMAILARFYSHAELTRSKGEAFWSRALIFEGAAAIFCGFVAMGIAEHFTLGQASTCALSAFSGFIGPKGLVEIVTRFAPKK